MKKILLIIMIVSPLLISAQPTITNMLNMPVGASYTMRKDSTLGVNSGGEGANQTWNYGSILPTSPIGQFTATSITPASPVTDSFPSATTVIHTGPRYDYYVYIGNNAYQIGYNLTTTGLYVYYSNSILTTVDPITYGDSVPDNFQRHFRTGGNPASGIGNEKYKADGYGTVTTPAATYTNCLRVKIHKVNIDTIFGSTMSILHTNTTTYWWFDGVDFAPVMVIDSIVTNGNLTMDAHHLLNPTVGINETSQEKTMAMVFPNPSSNQFTLCYHLTTPNAILQINDVEGRLVHQENISGTIGNAVISTSDYPNGIYFWEIRSGEEVQSKGKLEVQK